MIIIREEVSGVESRNKRKYNDDFKKMVVELYHTGSSVSTLSSEYGVSEVTIYKWIKALTPVNGEENGLTPQDITEIQKENLRMKQEIEILKKAMAIFARK
jgi:transposase